MNFSKIVILSFLIISAFSGCSLFDSGSSTNFSGSNLNGNNSISPSTAICPSGEWTSSGQAANCVACPSGSSPNSGSTFCVCSNTSYYFDVSQNECLINTCTGNTWPFNAVCTSCPSGSTINTNNTGCNCATGAFNYSSNTCSTSGGFSLWELL